MRFIITLTMNVIFLSMVHGQIFIDDGTDGVLSITNASSGTLGTAESSGAQVGLFVDGDLVIEGTYNNQATETQIAGGISNSGTFNTTGDEVLVNSSAKNISGTFNGTNDFFNLILKSPSAPVAEVVCANNIEINSSGILKLEGGILNASSNYVLIKNTSTNAIQGIGANGDLDNFILGEIRRNILAGFTYEFPTGGTATNAGGGDGQQKVSFTSNTGNGIVSVDFSAGDGIGVSNNTVICSGSNGTIDYLINNGDWTITNPGGGISNYDVTLHPTDFTDNSYVDYTILKDGAATGLDACDGVANTLPITHSGFTSFSLFQVGARQNSALLPVELIDFAANPTDQKEVKVSWSTLSESNNDYFTVQRSKSGDVWEDIGRVNGREYSDQRLDYHFMDAQPILDGAYYRLKQTDIDGRYTYSEIKFVVFSQKVQAMVVFPNPAKHQLTIKGSMENIEVIKLYNSMGEELNINSLIINHYDESKILDITSLPIGIYYLQGKSQSIKIQKI